MDVTRSTHDEQSNNTSLSVTDHFLKILPNLKKGISVPVLCILQHITCVL